MQDLLTSGNKLSICCWHGNSKWWGVHEDLFRTRKSKFMTWGHAGLNLALLCKQWQSHLCFMQLSHNMLNSIINTFNRPTAGCCFPLRWFYLKSSVHSVQYVYAAPSWVKKWRRFNSSIHSCPPLIIYLTVYNEQSYLILIINSITFQHISHVFKKSLSPAEWWKDLTWEHGDI